MIPFWSAVQDYGLKLWEHEAVSSRTVLNPLFYSKTALKNNNGFGVSGVNGKKFLLSP